MHGKIFCITGPLWGESIDHHLIHLIKNQYCGSWIFSSTIQRNSRDLTTYYVHMYLISSPRSAAYMRRWAGSALVQIMACPMIGTKPLSEPIRNNFQWSRKQNSHSFIQENALENCRLRNGGHFVQGEMSYTCLCIRDPNLVVTVLTNVLAPGGTRLLAGTLLSTKFKMFLKVTYRIPYDVTLQWRHNEHDGVTNHQPHDCLLNRIFRRRSKKTSKLLVTGLCEGNHRWPVNSHTNGQ